MSLSRNIFYTFLTQIPVQIFGVVAGVLIARMLGPEGKGAYAIYHANSMLLVTFFSFSLNTSLTYFISSGKADPGRQLGLAIIIMFIGVLLSVGGIFIIASPYLEAIMIPEAFDNQVFFIWMGVFVYISMSNTILSGFFQGYKRFRVINKIAIFNSILSLFLFVVLFFLDKYGVYQAKLINVLWILAFVAIFNHLQYIYSFLKYIGIKPDFSIKYKADVYPVLIFLLPAHLSIVVNFFNYRLKLWFLNYYIDEVTIGLFALASNLAAFFTMVTVPISNVMTPYLASEKADDRINVFSRYSRLNFSIVSFGALVAFFIADFIIPLVYGSEFAHSAYYFKWMLPGIILGCQTKIFASFIISSGKQKYNLYATILAFICNLFFSSWLIPMFGGMGAVWVSNIINIALFLSVMLSSHLFLNLPVKNHYLLTLRNIKTIINDSGKK